MPNTTPSVLSEFKTYAIFSVRVDRYFNFVNVYGYHHNALSEIYHALPERLILDKVLNSGENDEINQYISISANSLSYMATTNIFRREGDHAGGDISIDAMNFAFYTCYCFQWSLFEEYTKTMIQKTIDANALPADLVKDLKKIWRSTKVFFDKIHSGAVFGRSPFSIALPKLHSPSTVEEIGYDQLNAIRELRNEFIHGVESPDITSEGIDAKQIKYSRSMWILRKFAENIQWEVQRVLTHRSE